MLGLDPSYYPKIPCGTPTITTLFVLNFNQFFVASMHRDIFQGQIDKGLINGIILQGKLGCLIKRKK
jgi:hypothetical protein